MKDQISGEPVREIHPFLFVCLCAGVLAGVAYASSLLSSARAPEQPVSTAIIADQ